MKTLLISISIFSALAFSRFIPHPPNFRSLIALSFYVPVLLGLRFLPVLIISFAVTDLIIGYHSGTHWTWGSILLIGILSQYFTKSLSWRLGGALLGAILFFLITNFGVWTTGMYGLSIEGLYLCFALAVPFFTYSVISTLLFSLIIESINKLYKNKSYILSNIF